jgi:hypothetical protein
VVKVGEVNEWERGWGGKGVGPPQNGEENRNGVLMDTNFCRFKNKLKIHIFSTGLPITANYNISKKLLFT